VSNKPDDYGNKRLEIVHTTLKNSKDYYSSKEISKEDATFMEKYFGLITYKEESQRSYGERFYGYN
jgi:hypothetical protein